jgi:Uma2 family endonuclease
MPSKTAEPERTLNGLFESESLYEVVNGERREKPPMGAFAAIVASLFAGKLSTFVSSRRLGLIGSETLFRLGKDGPDRRPDIAFVATERLRGAPPLADDPAAWAVGPNLAVEVISPSNTAADVQEKLNDYFRAGVQIGLGDVSAPATGDGLRIA